MTRRFTRQQIRNYFSALLAQNSGVVTNSILQQADEMYEQGCSDIAAGLHLTPRELRSLLAREREVTCETCQTIFVVTENRCYGGYTPSLKTTCYDCEREEHSRKDAIRRHTEEQRQRQEKQRARIDALLSVGNPEAMLQYDQRLSEYLVTFPNCMVCSSDTTHIYITKDQAIDHPEFQSMLRAAPDYGPVTTYEQVFWRLEPKQYFSGVRPPLIQMPLLILCKDCAKLFASSHDHIGL